VESGIDDSGMIPHDRDEMYALDALLLSVVVTVMYCNLAPRC
jgi:hypothetical protein